MEQEKPRRRISNGTAVAMVGVALLLDAISLIPVAGSIVSTIFGMGIFGLWFYRLDVPLISPKKFASWGLNAVVEAFPGLGSIWVGVTVGVILMIVITRTEDKTGLQIANKVGVKPGLSAKKVLPFQPPAKAIGDQVRLQRRLARQAELSALPQKERPQIKDINFPKAA